MAESELISGTTDLWLLTEWKQAMVGFFHATEI